MSRPSATRRGPVDIPVLEVGGTHVTAGWVRPEGWQVSGLSRAELPAEGTAEQLIDALARAGAGLEAEPGAAWGIAMPGPFDYARGVAHYAGVGKFEALAGVDVRSALHQALPHQPGSLCFSNDASAFLVGEWLIGAARGATRCVAVTLGTGVGSAFLDRGTVIDTGSSVPPQAELHLLNHAGRPLEDWVSRRAIRAAFAGAGGRHSLDGPRSLNDSADLDVLDVREIAELARAGDQAAAAAFNGAFEVLGEVLGPWLERFGADLLVIGGSISRSWDLIERPLRNGLSRCSDWRFSIETAASPELSPLVGAAYPAVSPTS
ncbi:MAG: ROK family protein [Jatrophihabitantaceae bacterium]